MTRCWRIRMSQMTRMAKIKTALDAELTKTLKDLRLWGLQRHWDEYLALAQEQDFSPVKLLRYVVEEEGKLHRDNARRLRLKRADIPELFLMETFPFEQQPKLDKKKILSLYDGFDYMTQHRNCLWLGPTGCGKTGLATTCRASNDFLAPAVFIPVTIHRLTRCVQFHYDYATQGLSLLNALVVEG